MCVISGSKGPVKTLYKAKSYLNHLKVIHFYKWPRAKIQEHFGEI